MDDPRTPGLEGGGARSSGWMRLLAGVLLGAVVGGLAGAGVYALQDDDSSAAPVASAPATTRAQSSNGDVNNAATNTIEQIVNDSSASIVSIHDEITQTDIFGQEVAGQAAGTGFVLTTDGMIVTNDHVISGATNITVDFADRSDVPAKVVAADPSTDLAVLHVDRNDVVPLAIGDSDELAVGAQVVAIGNALDLSGGPSVTTGIVSATGRNLTEPSGATLTDLIQTDTAINPGNSGGPLLDMGGRVVGINTAIAGSAQNIGFAIAITPAMATIDQLKSGTVPEHAVLGVTATQFAGANGETGAQIVTVAPGSAADQAGLRAGDVIVAIDDTKVTDTESLAAAITGHRPGDTVTVTYQRNGNEHSVDATLGARAPEGG